MKEIRIYVVVFTLVCFIAQNTFNSKSIDWVLLPKLPLQVRNWVLFVSKNSNIVWNAWNSS